MLANNKSSSILIGSICLLVAAISWGGMFPVAKATLRFVDPYFMTLIRYSITAIIMLVILWWVEGRRAIAAEGKRGKLLLYGSAGFSGFGLLVFTGLLVSTPAHGAIIVALMPLLTALINSITAKTLPAIHTRISIVLALIGVSLVVSNGHLSALLHSTSAWADLLIFLGVISWVIYTLGAKQFPGWSPLRYSVMTVNYGVISIAFFTALAMFAGMAHVPAISQLADTLPNFFYIVVFASVIAVIGWNEGVRRVGPVNGVLFINFVPITAFIIQALQGATFSAWELSGAAMVITALFLNNFMQRLQLNAVRIAHSV